MVADSGLAALEVPAERIVAPDTVDHQKTGIQRTLTVGYLETEHNWNMAVVNSQLRIDDVVTLGQMVVDHR
jgi:hypothetical protein